MMNCKCLVAVCLAVAAGPCIDKAFSQERAQARWIEQARKEAALDFAWPLFGGQPEIDALTSVFVKHYGFRPSVRVTPVTDIPAVVAKTVQEQKAGRHPSSEILVGSETHVVAMVDADALENVDWGGFSDIPAGLLEAEGRAIPLITRLPGVTYNSNKVPLQEVPRTVEEFLQTKHVVATTPYGANLNILASKEVWGPERTIKLARRLSGKAEGLINCGHANRILTGEFDMFGLDCGSLEALKFAARGAPLKSVVLRDAAIQSYLYVGIPKGSGHPALARLFVAVMLSREGQDAIARNSFADLHRLPGSTTAAEVARYEADGSKFVDVNYDFARRSAADVTPLRRTFIGILERKP